jgi:hypothetical protein
VYGRYVLFVWKPSGYVLEEREGEIPPVGAVIELPDGAQTVGKIAPSPLPGDTRPCLYLQA